MRRTYLREFEFLAMAFDELIDAALDNDVRVWRQAIHANPEMALKETQTASLVARELRSFGYRVETGIA